MVAAARSGFMKKRKINIYETIEKRYYIFCEGKQTEPNYFKGFKEAIEVNPIYKNRIFIQIEGTGSETKRVIGAARDYIENNGIENAEIWCVYDKDSFPSADFNAVSETADSLNRNDKSLTYRVAWSNQCIEYWFILHFDYYDSDNNRMYYRKYLHKRFADFGLTRYEKRNPGVFAILLEFGNPKTAIKHAKRQLDFFEGKTDSESAPATKVHLLVEELSKYLPEELKSKFL